jgi:DNA-binding NtrC family response regulator
VGRIHLPPLRERKADIAGLAERIVLDLNRKLGRRIEGVTKEAIGSLVQHDWPGNVRELKNVIERIFITRESGQIDGDDLYRVLPRRPLQSPSVPDEELRGLREALVVCNGNKSKAAERLNWSRMTLYRKLAKYGLVHGEGRKESISNNDVERPRRSA